MVNDKKVPKKLSENVFPRWLLFGVGGVVALSYLELNVFQIFRSQDNELGAMYELGGFLTLLLIIPFIAFVMVPLIDTLNNIANRRPILIRISEGKVYAKRLDCEISYECAGDFSQQSGIVADAGKFAETASEAIRSCSKDSKVFSLSPYIVFTASEKLPKAQRIAAEEAIRHAGALDVIYMEKCLSDSEALEFVRQNPTSFNFA